MKKMFLLLFTSLLFVSCSSDDEAIIAVPLTENDMLGKWEVADVEKTTGDTTENLRGFVFEFKTNNELLITNESESFTIEGSWSVLEIKKGLQILVPTKEAPLRMFHNEWDVNILSSLNVSLSGLSNELNGTMEHVNFEKL